MKTRAHIFISGRVQGVFFRVETKYEADKRKIKGWVRNLPDGRVEAVFEGEKDSLDELIEFCRKGPPGARVENIKVIWEDYSGEFEDFKTLYRYL